MAKSRRVWIGSALFSIAVATASTPAQAATDEENAAIGVQPAEASWDGRGAPSLRIPKSMLAQAAPAAVPAKTAPAFEEFGARKSYSIPAMEIVGFDILLNRYNKAFSGSSDYDVSGSSIRRNLRSRWVNDNDPYRVNQLGHPYQGSMYHGFARSAGLSYWESAGYAFAGSVAWEIAGEKTLPSRNDQVASGIAGSFLGEALFRMSNLVLEHGDGVPRFWREVVAAAISPSTGFNRLAFGERFDPIFSSRDAAYYSRLQLGLSGTTRNIQGTSTEIDRNEVLLDYSMEYGLPGKDDYDYRRPFDYFAFQTTASSANVFENVLIRGLLAGKEYEAGRNVRGVFGLYGSYDYISPQTYRVSSTALSLGSTAQWWATPTIAVQGTAMAGAGYAAVGTLHGAADYRYGVAPQALLALRVIFGERAALDFTGREYFVSRVNGGSGHDNIVRADVSFTVRVHKQHAVALKYLWNRRDATNSALGDTTQTRATLGLFYSYVGHDLFGAVAWR